MGSKEQTKRNLKIAAMVGNGRLLADIADLFQITTTRVQQIANSHGVKNPRGHIHVNPEQIGEILDLYDSGYTVKEIAEKMDRDRNTITRYLAKHRGYKAERNDRAWEQWEEDLIKRRYNISWGEVKHIAEELGRTRDSIIGKANRLGLGKLRRAPHHPLRNRRTQERLARGG